MTKRDLLVAVSVVLALGACVQPRTIDLPLPSPVPTRTPSAESPRPTHTPRPAPDVAGIRCGDERHEEVKGTSVVTRTTCYRVEGTTMEELDAQMDKKGPLAEGTRAVAVTRWVVRWSYQTRSDGSSCELLKPSIETLAVFNFPTWDPGESVSEEMVSQWRGFMRGVEVHEEHHRSLAVKAGLAIRRALMGLPSAGTCSILEEEADRTFHEVYDVYEAKQEAFDAAAGGASY
jgi:predicted secreted Zn-dependent protease